MSEVSEVSEVHSLRKCNVFLDPAFLESERFLKNMLKHMIHYKIFKYLRSQKHTKNIISN